MKDKTLIVIGGGPAGAAAAINARKAGLDVTLLEKKSRGRLKPCAGGISPKAEQELKEQNLWERIQEHIYEITSAKLITPKGKELILAGDATASVIHRPLFDKLLLDYAESLGVELRENCAVSSVTSIENGKSTITLENGEILYSNCTIIANGANTRLTTDNRPKTHIASCTAWFEGEGFTPGRMEMIFSRELSPHYGWLFPESETNCNIGLCVYKEKIKGQKITSIYNHFLETYFRDHMKDMKQVTPLQGFPIIPAGRIQHNARPGTFLAGDAGRYINAFTGEGISYALISGRLTAESAVRIIKGETLCEQEHKRYLKEIKHRFRKGLNSGHLLCKTTPAAMGALDMLSRSERFRKLFTNLVSKV